MAASLLWCNGGDLAQIEVLKKQGNQERVLQVLIFEQADFEAAEAYCFEGKGSGYMQCSAPPPSYTLPTQGTKAGIASFTS